MNKSITKRAVALMLALILLAMSVISTCAYGEEEYNEVLDETIEIGNHQVHFYTYNISKNHMWAARLSYGENFYSHTDVYARDCVDESYSLNLLGGSIYKLELVHPEGGSGNMELSFDNTGGTYRKVRIKLSQYSHFNEDGSHTSDKFTYYYGDDQHVGKSTYASVLVFVSGGVVTFVAPDENGYVEFYASEKIGADTIFDTAYEYEIYNDGFYTSGGNSGAGGNVYGLSKGVIDNNRLHIKIDDVTAIQRYIAQYNSFSDLQKYRADVDCSGAINILDATKIQQHLAKK